MKLKDDIPCGIGKNSWYLQKTEKNGLTVHAFSCKCGVCKIYIDKQKSISYRCKKCSCDYFYRLSDLVNHNNVLLVNIELKPSLEKYKNNYKATFFLDIPIDIDINSTKLLYKKEKIYTLQINSQGEQTTDTKYTLSRYPKEEVEKLFCTYIFNDIQKRVQNTKQLNFEELEVSQQKEIVSYFVKYPAFLDASFYFWQRKYDADLMNIYKTKTTPHEALFSLIKRQEKSIKRTLFNLYSKNMRCKNFDPMVVMLICYIFEDPNIVCKLLEDTTTSFGQEHLHYSLKHMFGLFDFLKLYYTKHELFRFIQEIKTNFTLFEDVYNMYIYDKSSLDKYFVKVKISLQNIHDEFVKAHHMNHVASKYSFDYDEKYKQACGLNNGLEYKLPYNGKELSSWSIELNNCLFSYAEKIKRRYSVIYGVFKQNRLVYALEISNEEVRQALKHSNLPIPSEDYRLIYQWFLNYFKKC